MIRHGAASEQAASDHERPLSPAGADDARAAARWMTAHEHAPSWMYASTATRAEETGRALANGIELVLQPELYLANVEVLTDFLHGIPDSISHAAVVAHNPGLTHWVSILTGQPAVTGLSPLTCVLLHSARPWLEWRDAACSEVERWSPVGLS